MKNYDHAFMAPEAEWLGPTELAEWEYDSVPGWYARLSASGYLDCTDWSGPFPNAFRALRYVCDMYEIDIRGNNRDWS